MLINLELGENLLLRELNERSILLSLLLVSIIDPLIFSC